MNIYIMTDMEGISGLSRSEQCKVGSSPWRDALSLAEGDFNAAVAGAAAGGAKKIVLCDGHGAQFRVENMDPRAEYEQPVSASNWLPAVKAGGFNAAFIIGAHAMAGTAGAFLEHTQSSAAWHNYTVGGKPWGEICQMAATIGQLDIPVVLVTGDEAACQEARRMLGEVETVVVKTALSRNFARVIAPSLTRKAIEEAAARALRHLGRVKPFKAGFPVEVRLEFNNAELADGAARRPGVRRLDGRTVGWTARSAAELLNP